MGERNDKPLKRSLLAPLRDLPEPWKRQLRQGFRTGVHVYRSIPIARMIGLRLAALSPGLKARLVHRFIAYERLSEPGLALPAHPSAQGAPLQPPPELSDAERSAFLRLAARHGGI
jgi:hypothetical protein